MRIIPSGCRAAFYAHARNYLITLKAGPREAGGHIGMHPYIACMLPQLSYVVAAQACYGCMLYKSPRGSVLRAPATLTGIRTFRSLRGSVLIPVVLRKIK